jgi:hypothetical protein
MITSTFNTGGNNNHVDGSPPTRQRGSKFWYIVIWKDLETVHPAFDPQANNVSIFKHVSPDCKKRAHVKKCARFAQYPASVSQPVQPPGEQYLQNSSFTMSISKFRAAFAARKIPVKWSNWTVPVFTTAKLKLGDGGDRRDRTDDLKLAKLPLYQLSYVPSLHLPKRSGLCPTSHTMVGLGRLELPTSRLSSARSNQLSYRPETGNSLCCVTKKEKRRRRHPAKLGSDFRTLCSMRIR